MVKDTPPDPHGGLTGNVVDYLFAECLEGTKAEEGKRILSGSVF